MDVARSGPFCACRWLPSCSMVWMSPALVTGGGARSGLAQRRGCGPATGQARLHDLRHAGPALDRDRVAGFSPCCSTWALDTPGQHHTRENRPPEDKFSGFRCAAAAAKVAMSPHSQGAAMKTRVIQDEPDEPAPQPSAAPPAGKRQPPLDVSSLPAV